MDLERASVRFVRLLPAIFGAAMLFGSAAPAEESIARARPAQPREATRATLKRAIAPWIGTPWAYGVSQKQRGTDCSGFVRSIAREHFGVPLPRSSEDQFSRGQAVKKKHLRAGDLVFFSTGQENRVNHVGIYMGRGMFAHASQSRGVVYDALGDYKSLYRGARRVFRAR